MRGRGKKINLEKFLIFNQQFVTLIRAGLADPEIAGSAGGAPDRPQALAPHQGRARRGPQRRDALRRFRPAGRVSRIYVTSVLAGERSGSLPEVLERFITYQRLALSVRKKLLVSLMYPAVLVFLALA